MIYTSRKKTNIIVIAGALLLALVVAGATVWLLLSDRVAAPTEAPSQLPLKAVKAESKPLAKIAPQLPKRIKIGKVEIDADILSVGLEPNGAMAAPAGLKDVGWYDGSAKLGSSEHALLLDGHYGMTWNQGVFYKLSKVKLGDTIEVTGVRGDTAKFEVKEVERKSRHEVDMEKAFNYGGDKKESLALITCQGNWDGDHATYDDRYIVYAIRTG